MAPKADKYTFVGFEDGAKVIKYWNGCTINTSQNYKFTHTPPANDTDICLPSEGENTSYKWQTVEKQTDEDTKEGQKQTTDTPRPNRPIQTTTKQIDYKCLHNPNAWLPGAQQQREKADTNSKTQTESIELVFLANMETTYLSNTSDPSLEEAPNTLEEARGRQDWKEWEKAINSELDTHKQMGTWDKKLVDLLEGKGVVDCRLVFAIKQDHEGKVVKYKARLVVRGFTQTYGTDYFDMFAPVVRMDLIRAILGIAAILDLEIRQFNIKSAYLNGELDEEVYMKQPEGYDDGSRQVLQL